MKRTDGSSRDALDEAGWVLAALLLPLFVLMPPLTWAFLWELIQHPGIEADGQPCTRDWKFWSFIFSFFVVTHGLFAWLLLRLLK